MQKGYVYIMSNKPHGTLYIGVASNLSLRIWQHKQKFVKGFTQKYNLDKLVYFESFSDLYQARERECQLKWWQRQWKIDLIETLNPDWQDLYESLF